MKGQVQMATIKKRSIGVKAAHSQVSPKGTRTLDFHVGAFGQDDGDDSTGPGENTTDWAGLEQAEKEQEELLDEMLSKPALNAKTDALAQKYGVDIDDDEDDDSDDSLLNFDEEKEEEQENPITEKYEKMTKEEVVLDALALREEVAAGRGEVRKLGCLLEALAPVPGLDPEALLDLMEGTEVVDKDYRDAKIVQLAKKARNLTVALNAERARAEKVRAQLAEARAEAARLEGELARLASPAARAAAARGGGAAPPPPPREGGEEAAAADRGRERALQHQLDEAKRKLHAQGEELKRAQRALQKELGDGSLSLEAALEEGWRGRAQQIVMLRAKVKRLEAEGGAAAGGRGGARPPRRRDDVDAKAQEDLQDMGRQRQAAVEQLSLDLQAAGEEVERQKQRGDAAKARTKVLERENAKMKESLKVLVGKAGTDDALVDALRGELRGERSRAAALARDLQQTTLKQKNSSSEISDVANLKAQIKRQAEQIERQEKNMQQMRSELHAYRSSDKNY